MIFFFPEVSEAVKIS